MPNSRTKGSKCERLAAKIIGDWTGRKFQRTPSSGGLQWKSSFAKGDIVCCTEGHFFPFCVEVKFHKEIDFSQLLTPGKKGVKVRDFWKQCSRDAKEAGKIPMLVMRYNGMPKELFYLAIPTNFEAQIIGLNRLTISTYIRVHTKDMNITIFPSTEFFQLPYKEIKKLAKTHIKSWKKK